MNRRNAPNPPMSVPEGRRGLTLRLQQQARERERLLLPVIRVPQVKDEKK